MKDTEDMSHDHVDPLFRNILNAVSGQMEAITAMRSDIKLKHMPDTQRLTVQQAEAINKALDLIDSLMQEVHDPLDQERYNKKYNEVLDELFPERTSAKPSNNE
jgi:hypothetical protein